MKKRWITHAADDDFEILLVIRFKYRL